MFSLEQLLFALGYDQRVSPDTMQQMLPMLQEVFEKESAAREQLKVRANIFIYFVSVVEMYVYIGYNYLATRMQWITARQETICKSTIYMLIKYVIIHIKTM